MEKKKHLFGVVFMVVCLCASAAPAFDPMGPPTAGLKQSSLSAGVEYMWSNMDIESYSVHTKVNGIPAPGLFVSGTVKNVESNKIYANLGFGMTDDWEVFLRLGAADADPDKSKNSDNLAGYTGCSDYGFAIGGGTKITFLKSENGKLKWGALAQVSWAILDFDRKSYSIDGYDATLSAEIDLLEAQLAVGPTYNLREGVSIYGGPFFHFINGEADLKGSIDGMPLKVSADLKQDSIFGGYVGIQIDIKPSPSEVTNGCYLFGEFQFTGDGWGFGTGFGYKF